MQISWHVYPIKTRLVFKYSPVTFYVEWSIIMRGLVFNIILHKSHLWTLCPRLPVVLMGKSIDAFSIRSLDHIEESVQHQRDSVETKFDQVLMEW